MKLHRQRHPLKFLGQAQILVLDQGIGIHLRSKNLNRELFLGPLGLLRPIRVLRNPTWATLLRLLQITSPGQLGETVLVRVLILYSYFLFNRVLFTSGVFPSQADEQSETGHSAEQALISDDYPSSISTPSHPSSRSSGVSLQEPVSLLDVDNPWHFLDQILHLPRVSTRSTGDKSDPFDGLRSYDRSGLGFNPNSSVGDYWAQNYTNEVIDDDDGSSDHGLLLFEDCSSVTSPEDNSGVHAVFSTPPDGHLRDDKDREICAIVDNSVEGVTEKLTAGPTSIFGASFEYYVRHATDRPSDESGSGDEKNGSDIEEFKQIPSCNVVATNQAGHAVQTGELDLHTPPPILSELMFDDDDNEVEFEGPDLFVGLDDIDDDDDE